MAGIVKVSVKWQRKEFPGVEIDTQEPPALLKAQLFTLTGVEPSRQKILIKGAILQDDSDWTKAGLKEGMRLMLMGSAEAIPTAPEKEQVFEEDVQIGSGSAGYKFAANQLSGGLVNLGNTCYMNSTLQCLRAVPEIRTSVSEFRAGAEAPSDLSTAMVRTVREIFQSLGQSQAPFNPHHFLQLLRKKFPQFAQIDREGNYMQQDAEECWTQIVFVMSRLMPRMENIFTFKINSTLKCAESGEESSESELSWSLKCHISSTVNQLHEGLEAGLKGELEKVSPALGRTAVFQKDMRMASLPLCLTTQLVRFFWKRESQQKAKILRKVGIPLVLDVYSLCTPELQAALAAPRKALKELEDIKAGLASAAAPPREAPPDTSSSSAAVPGGSTAMEEDATQSAPPGAAEEADLLGGDKDFTGFYDLIAVLTHKGRSADSGHYEAWVKQANGHWIEFDDETGTIRKEDEILKLSGGGDWHMAYILIYRARKVKVVAP